MSHTVLHRFILLMVLAFWTASVAARQPEAPLRWDSKAEQVSADIRDWTLDQFLEEVAERTGWEVYVEPGTSHPVSAKFADLPMDEALKRLLGKLNYALVRQKDGAPKFYVFRTTMGHATELVGAKIKFPIGDPRRHLILNELVVTLAPDATMTIEELAKQLNAQIVGRAEELRTYRLRFKNEADALAAREKLKDLEQVASVDSNYRFDPPPPTATMPTSSQNSFGLKATGSPDGKLVIGLIDSAVQNLPPDMQGFVLPGKSTSGESGVPSDVLSHGTSIAQSLLQSLGLAQSGESNVRILPVDVYGSNPNTTTYDVAYGIYLAVNNGATIINLSLGSAGDSDFLHRMIREGRAQGVLFFGAAGNEPVTTATFPAAYPEVIAVTASDRKGDVASYANRGPFVDVKAPGSTVITFNNIPYMVGGTSVATAFVTGLAAGSADMSGKSLAEIEALIRQKLAYNPAGKTP